MNDVDLLELLLGELERVAGEWKHDPPVNTYGSHDSTEVPIMLLDDSEGHVNMHSGDNPVVGQATDDQGNVLGLELEFEFRAQPEVVVRESHETDSYRLAEAVKQRFYTIIRDVKGYDETWHDDVRSLKVKQRYPRNVDLDYGSGDQQRVYTQAIPLEVTYIERLVYDKPEPIESIKNIYDIKDLK